MLLSGAEHHPARALAQPPHPSSMGARNLRACGRQQGPVGASRYPSTTPPPSPFFGSWRRDQRGRAAGRSPAQVSPDLSHSMRQGYVDHTIYDVASLLFFVEKRFGLRPLTFRDAAAADMGPSFDFA